MKKAGAIATDAPGKEPGDEEIDPLTEQPAAKEQPPSPRDLRMQEIVEQRRQTLDAEASGETVPPAGEGDAVLADDEQPETIAQPVPKVHGVPATVKDGKTYVKVKVHGQEHDVPLDDVVARAQKNWAADIRLQDAATREAGLTERELRIKKAEDALASRAASGQSTTVTTPSGSAPAADDTEAELDSVVSSLFQGDEEKAKQGLRKILAGRQTTTQATVDSKAIVAEALTELRKQETEKRQAAYKQRLQGAMDVFQAEFSDIAEDQVLSAAWDAETARLQSATPEKDLTEIVRDAGAAIRKRLGAPAASSTQERQERKRTATAAVVGIQRAAQTGKDEPQPKTRADIVADMKKARGQPA